MPNPHSIMPESNKPVEIAGRCAVCGSITVVKVDNPKIGEGDFGAECKACKQRTNHGPMKLAEARLLMSAAPVLAHPKTAEALKILNGVPSDKLDAWLEAGTKLALEGKPREVKEAPKA